MLRFEWDDGNRDHIALHQVTPQEAEEALSGPSLEVEYEIRNGEERIREVGATARGRILSLVIILREDRVRVVTAYDASRHLKMAFLAYQRHYYE